MRVPVDLRHAYRLLNHGPTTLVVTSAGGRTNVMAAAWVMPLDFTPPKIAAVIATGTHTRALLEENPELTVCVPTAAQADLTFTVGSVSGADLDKLERFALRTSPASKVAPPLLEGCSAWLECRVVPEPGIAQRYDLFVAEVLAAWADDTVFANGEWRFVKDEQRGLHHSHKGVFFLSGERVQAKRLDGA